MDRDGVLVASLVARNAFIGFMRLSRIEGAEKTLPLSLADAAAGALGWAVVYAFSIGGRAILFRKDRALFSA